MVKTFELSRDPKLLEKLTDVVGLYVNPPEKGVVPSVDQKSQIQTLEQIQPGRTAPPRRRKRKVAS